MSHRPSTLDINHHEQHDEQQSCDGEVEAEAEDDEEVIGASGPMGGSLQRLLQKEGPDARNVVSWLVPNLTGGGFGGSSMGGLAMDARSACPSGGTRGEDSRETSRERDHGRRKSPMTSPFKSSNGSHSSKNTPGWRGRASDSSTQGFNQRLWGYLFRNVNRTMPSMSGRRTSALSSLSSISVRAAIPPGSMPSLCSTSRSPIAHASASTPSTELSILRSPSTASNSLPRRKAR